MARKFKLWRAFFLSLYGGLVALVLGVFQPREEAQAQKATTHIPGDALQLWNQHWLPTPLLLDGDQDLIFDAEEITLGLDLHDPDENRSRVIDGPELAEKYEEIIDGLPYWNPPDPPPNGIVKTDYKVWGVEFCEVCGHCVNMGFLRIYNPWKDISIDVHYIALHYLRHGSYNFDGTINEGRIDLERLDAVLEDLHRLKVNNDSDGDLLADDEELGIGSDPYEHDENGNFVRDGVDRTVLVNTQIDLLPFGPLSDRVYRLNHPTFGEETCEVCGEVVNMGCLEITDPLNGLTVNIPYIGLHYMQHGSFSYDGTTNDGRVDVVLLESILQNAR